MKRSKLSLRHEAAAVVDLAETMPPAIAAADIDGLGYHGPYLLYRKAGKGIRRLDKTDRGGRLPKFKHQHRDQAVSEAVRLLALYPQSTFIILQEVGHVRMKARADG